MCNIYKNNLIVLSQLNDSQLIYYDDENQLKPDDRYLSYFRPGTKESKIGYIIKNSFLQIFNCYIINLVSQETQKENQYNNNLIEIENNKHLLRKSLEGLEKYKKSLEYYKHNFNYIEVINKILNKVFDNIEEYKLEYLLTIQTHNESKSKSKGWLYQLYESTLKSSPTKNQYNNSPSESLDEETDIIENNLHLELNNSVNEDSEDNKPQRKDSNTETKVDEPQLGEYLPEELEDEYYENTNYMRGFIYLISRKIFNIFITIGKHINTFI